MDKEYVVSGIVFSNEVEYKSALRDEKNIEAISAKIDLSDPNIVLKIFNALITKKTFKTAVGFSFLKQLRDILIMNEQTAGLDIPVLDYRDYVAKDEEKKTAKENNKNLFVTDSNRIRKNTKESLNEQKIKDTNFILKCTVVIMAICIVVMFIFTLKSDTLTYNRAKDEVIDEYEEWNQELTEREKAIEMKENEADS